MMKKQDLAITLNHKPLLLFCPPAIWTICSAVLVVSGWFMSLTKALNPIGYTTVFVGLGMWACFRCWAKRPNLPPSFRFSRLRQRLQRPLPAAFCVLTGMATLGGFLHGPTNYDGLAYRIPRVLHWLAEDQWHWIHTDFQRLNTRACGFEWLMAPFLCLFKTDRFIFLINVAMFLLLPGLCFSVLCRLGVLPRVASAWMWILPTGYCFLLQAGSIANDLVGAVYAMIALDFGLRARANPNLRDTSISVLAAALMTGSKASNLPLLLPWFITILPALCIFRHHFGKMIGLGLVGTLCSFAPMAALNFWNCDDWSGQKAESVSINKGRPLVYLINNTILLTIQNLVPPIFPFTAQWEKTAGSLMSEDYKKEIQKTFEPAGASWNLGEMQVEESAGLGLGLTALLIGSFIVGRFQRQTSGQRSKNEEKLGFVVFTLTCISLGVFMGTSGLSTVARLVTPYYLFFVPFLLSSPSQIKVIRHKLWRICTVLIFVTAALLLIISPARPLWPAKTIFSYFDKHLLPGIWQRAQIVYVVYGTRADAFAPAKALLPEGIKKLGLVTFDDPESSLWHPFNSRRIIHVTHQDSLDVVVAKDIQYILISKEKFKTWFCQEFENWLSEMGGTVTGIVQLKLRASSGPAEWLLVRIGSVQRRQNKEKNDSIHEEVLH